MAPSASEVTSPVSAGGALSSACMLSNGNCARPTESAADIPSMHVAFIDHSLDAFAFVRRRSDVSQNCEPEMSAASLDILPCALFTANAARFAVMAQGKTATDARHPPLELAH